MVQPVDEKVSGEGPAHVGIGSGVEGNCDGMPVGLAVGQCDRQAFPPVAFVEMDAHPHSGLALVSVPVLLVPEQLTRALYRIFAFTRTWRPGWAIATPAGLSLHRLDGNVVWQVSIAPAEVPGTLGVWHRQGQDDMIVGGRAGRIVFWDLATGDVIRSERTVGRAIPSSVVCVPVSRHRSQMLAVATGSTISLWGQDVRTTLESHAAVNALAVVRLPGKPPLLAAGTGTGVQLWDPRNRENVHTVLTAAPVTDLAHVRESSKRHRLWISGSAGIAALSASQL
ncbi:hypothetical protein [Streptomyces yangpuensis]